MERSPQFQELSHAKTASARRTFAAIAVLLLAFAVPLGVSVVSGRADSPVGAALGAALMLAGALWLCAFAASFRRVRLDGAALLIDPWFCGRPTSVPREDVLGLRMGPGRVFERPFVRVHARPLRRPVRFLVDSEDALWAAVPERWRLRSDSPRAGGNAAPRSPVRLSLGRAAETAPRLSVVVTAGVILLAGSYDAPLGMIGAVSLAVVVARRTAVAGMLAAPFLVPWVVSKPFLSGAPKFDDAAFSARTVAAIGAILIPILVLRRRAAMRVIERMRAPPPAHRSPAEVPDAGPALSSPTCAVDSTVRLACPVRDVDADEEIEPSPRGRLVAAIADARFRLCRRTSWTQATVFVTAQAVAWLADECIDDRDQAFGVPVVVVTIGLYFFWRLVRRAWVVAHGRTPPFRGTSFATRWRRRVVVILFASVILSLVCRSISALTDKAASPRRRSAAAVATSGYCLALLAHRLLRRRLKRRIADAARVFPPPRLLLLRAFRPGVDYERRTEEIFGLVQRRFTLIGHCVLLGGPDWFGRDLGLGLMPGGLDDGLARTPDEVDSRLGEFRVAARWPAVSGEYAYPPNSVLCAGEVWVHAFERLLSQADVVLLDFRAFSPENRGCAHELTTVVRRVPTSRFVILIDETMDRAFLADALDVAWTRRAPEPPPDEDPDPRVTVCTLRSSVSPNVVPRPPGPSPGPIDAGNGSASLAALRWAAALAAARATRVLSLLFDGVAAARLDAAFVARRERSPLEDDAR